ESSIRDGSAALRPSLLRRAFSEKAHEPAWAIVWATTQEYSLCSPENASNGSGQAFPACGLVLQPFLTCLRQPVEFRLTTVLPSAPVVIDQALLFETIQCRIQRTLLNTEHVPGDLLNAQTHTVAVH